MTKETSKIWIRLMAVLQLMTSLAFFQAGIIVYQTMTSNQTGYGSVSIAIAVVLSIVNLVAGWALLDETKFAFRLSFVNILAQTFSINIPIFSYFYNGVVHFAVSIAIHGQPNPQFMFGVHFNLLRSFFNVALSEIAQQPTFSVSPIALAFVIYLGRRLRLS